MPRLTIREAAQRLGLAELTIRRRLRSGLINGYQEDGRWWVELPDDEPGPDPESTAFTDNIGFSPELLESLQDTIRRQDEAISQLREQLANKDRQISELHVLLQQTQEQMSRMLPAPRRRHWWWPFS